jgi:hypothetical protein
MPFIDLSEAELSDLRSQASRARSISLFLRSMAEQYMAGRFSLGGLALMAHDVFGDRMSGIDHGMIWHWDYFRTGRGLTDQRLEDRLGHLLSPGPIE